MYSSFMLFQTHLIHFLLWKRCFGEFPLCFFSYTRTRPWSAAVTQVLENVNVWLVCYIPIMRRTDPNVSVIWISVNLINMNRSLYINIWLRNAVIDQSETSILRKLVVILYIFFLLCLLQVEKTTEALYKKQSTAAFKSATDRLVSSLFAKVRHTQHSQFIFTLS